MHAANSDFVRSIRKPNQVKELTKGNPFSLLILFSIPLLIGNVFQQFYSMADTIIVGRTIGLEPLAAIGLTAPLVFFILGFAQGLTGGFSIVTAQAFGKGDLRAVRHSFATSIILSFIISIIVSASTYLATDFLLSLIRTPKDLYDNAYTYIVITFLGTGALIYFNMLSSLLRALGNTKMPLFFLIIACIINIFLDYFFILNLNMGIAGAAIATIIAQIIPSLLCVLYIIKKIPLLRISKKDWHITKKDMLEHIRMGLPMGFQVSIIAIGMIILQYALNDFGAISIAAFTVASRIDALPVQCFLSFGIAMATYTAQNYGKKDIHRIRQGVRAGVVIVVLFSIFSGLMIFLFADISIKAFIGSSTSDEKVLAETVMLAKIYLKINCSLYIVLSLLILVRSALQGVGSSIVPTISGIMELIFRGAAALILPAYINFAGIAWAHPAAWIGACIIVLPAYFILIRRLDSRYSQKALNA